MNAGSESNLLLMRRVPGFSIISHSVSMLAFASKGGRFQVTRRIRSWAPGMRTSLHGAHIANTSVVSPTKQRSVHSPSHLTSTNTLVIDEHLQWSRRSRSCQQQVHSRLRNVWCCLYHLPTRIHSSRGGWTTPKRRTVCVRSDAVYSDC